MINLTVIGNLGYDCVVKEVGNEVVIAFSIAHNEKWIDKNGVANEKTLWISCSKWVREGNVSIAQYLKKGVKIWVSGRPEANAYQTKEGVWVSDFKLTIDRLELLGSKPAENEHANEKEAENE